MSQTESASLGRQAVEPKSPGWLAFNGFIAQHDMIRASIIGYVPIIAASPTELSVVCELLKQSVSLEGEI